jgi:hypothetical protein
LNEKREGWTVQHGLSASAFGSGLSKVPVTLNFDDGSSRQVDLLAGFFGVKQNSEDNALCPVISWSVVNSLPKVERLPRRERTTGEGLSEIFAAFKKPESGISGI